MVIEDQPECNEKWIKRVKQLPYAGMESGKGEVVKQRAKSVDRAGQDATDQPNGEDVQILAIEDGDDQKQNERCKTGAQRHDRKRRKALRDGEFSEDGCEPKK